MLPKIPQIPRSKTLHRRQQPLQSKGQLMPTLYLGFNDTSILRLHGLQKLQLVCLFLCIYVSDIHMLLYAAPLATVWIWVWLNSYNQHENSHRLSQVHLTSIYAK